MNTRTNNVLVGLFVLVLLGALIAGVLWLSAGGPPRDYDYYLTYMTESVSGLSVDAAVKYKGVNIGRVREIKLNPENPEEVRLLLMVLRGTPVKEDTVATLELQGLTGLANINLTGGSRNSAPLAKGQDEYPVIPSRPSLLVRLDDTLSELVGNLIETSASLNALLNEENRSALSATLKNVQVTTTSLAAESRSLEGIVGDARAALENVRITSERLPAVIEKFQMSAEALERMANALAETSGTLSDTGIALKRTVESSGRDIQRFTSVAMPEASVLVTELRQTAENLRKMSELLERDPSVLLYGGPPQEPGPGEN